MSWSTDMKKYKLKYQYEFFKEKICKIAIIFNIVSALYIMSSMYEPYKCVSCVNVFKSIM